MKTRILTLITLLAIILCSCGQDKADSEAVSTTGSVSAPVTEGETTEVVSDTTVPTTGSTPLLYKVTDNNGNILWLLGSIHVGREDFYPLPDYVLDAFEGSDALAVEFDLVKYEKDLKAQMNAMKLLVYTDGTKIKDHISKDVYDDAVEILKGNGLYNLMFDYYVPALWSSLIDSCAYMEMGVDTESGIDRYLIGLANDANMDILDIESAELQYGMMAGYSEELQVYMLEESIKSYGNMAEMETDLEKMMDLWASGNKDEFEDYLFDNSEFESEKEELLITEYYDALIGERNVGMTEFAEDALNSGDEVFVCVGAAHVVGESGIAESLRSMGYDVKLISNSYAK